MRSRIDCIGPLASAPWRLDPPIPPTALAPEGGDVHPRHRLKATVRCGELAGSPTGAESGQDISWPLPPFPSSVSRARHLAGDLLDCWGLGEHRHVAELLISELVTNAVRYGEGQIHVTVRSQDGTLRFEVEDQGPAASLRARLPHDGEEGGRGLHLVSLLSSRWGSVPTATGKAIWFELPAPRPFPDFDSDM